MNAGPALASTSATVGPLLVEVRRALRDVMGATGALRDEEVIIELVGSLGVNRPDVTAWLEVRRRRERRLRSALLRRVRAGEIDRGRELLRALLAFRVDPDRDRRLAKFARRAVDVARRDVERRRGARSDGPDTLHRLRIAYKRLRYTCEALSDGLPSELAALATAAACFQGRLGDLHDVDMTAGCVRRARGVGDEARQTLLDALALEREKRLAAYASACAAHAKNRPAARNVVSAPPLQAVGADSLRKTSMR